MCHCYHALDVAAPAVDGTDVEAGTVGDIMAQCAEYVFDCTASVLLRASVLHTANTSSGDVYFSLRLAQHYFTEHNDPARSTASF